MSGPEGTFQIDMHGELPIAWLGNFTRAATRLSLDILRGVARRDARRTWQAEFEMRAPPEVALGGIDFLALALQSSASGRPMPLELYGFDLSRKDGRPGTLELRVRARDRVGFLASLLEHLAGFVLFPEEIRIDTVFDEAEDELLLSSVGGQNPPESLEAALKTSLRACVVERRHVRA